MTFQAYMDNIQAKTGNSPEDFKALAKEKGLTTFPELMAWLKSDYQLGRGHAMAIAHVILETFDASLSTDEHVDKHFVGAKKIWRAPFDRLMNNLNKLGKDVRLSPSDSYISICRGETKIAIFHVTAKKVNVGVKLRGVPPRGRLEASGRWNSMVTHRVQITDPREVDDEVIGWVRDAYERA